MRVHYFLYNTATPAIPGDSIWNSPMPMNRSGGNSGTAGTATFGEYFQSIRRFLENNGFEPIRSALKQKSDPTVLFKDVGEIRILAEKHGEFYHPARILVGAAGEEIPFVLNVALSDEGKNLISKECALLKRLNRDSDPSFLPKVYASGDCETDGGLNPSLFLGEWFEDFHEFHLSRNPEGTLGLKVWDSVRGPYFLSARESFRLWSEMSMILTCHYNPVTFEQICPWRHAAGDFIVKTGDTGMDVRLVTVRGYDARFGGNEKNVEAVAGAMLLFFLDLSVWMRLDREDGVGDVAWAQDSAVGAVLEGFLRGIGENLGEAFADHFRQYLSACSQDDLSDLLDTVIRAYHPATPEIPVIRKNLASHSAVLCAALNRC